jgi:hypothetical protein
MDEFAEAFKMVTGKDPTPLTVAEALKNPKIKREIDDTMAAIRETNEEQADLLAD